MPLNDIFPTSLGQTQKVCFFDPANTSNSFTLNLNPITQKMKPGNLRKYTATTNATSVIMGSFEGPPTEISLTWPMLDASQLDLLVPFTQLAPIVYVDNNDVGYLGVLVIDEQEQLANYTRKIFSVTASFLVIGPYNGLHSNLNTLTAPTITATLSAATGYIPTGQDIYLWASVFTSRSAFSESVVGSVTHIHTSAGSVAYDLSWAIPTSTFFSKLRLYWNSVNDPTTSTLLSEIQANFPQDNPSTFRLYNNYVQYNQENPVLFGNCFPGSWCGGVWVQGT